MSKKRVIAVQLPAPCPMSCLFCRTPKHGEGDPEAVKQALWRQDMDRDDELYLTSNGETGLSPLFPQFIGFAKNHGLYASALGATVASVHPDLVRIEISMNRYTEKAAAKAVAKAHELRVPVVLSCVYEDEGIDQDALREKYKPLGIVVRAQQAEGLSTSAFGNTSWWRRHGHYLGAFPTAAYKELEHWRDEHDVVCINHFGEVVPWLGSPAGA
jgi:hypothetical protein